MTAPVQVEVIQLPHATDLPLPSYQSAGAAGADLVAAIPSDEPVLLAPTARALIATGLKLALPDMFEAQVRPRSGLAARHGITVANAPGTIDSDYRGEVHVLLINLGPDVFTIERGMRIAQLVIAPVMRADFKIVDALDDSDRGTGGFGSTGQ